MQINFSKFNLLKCIENKTVAQITPKERVEYNLWNPVAVREAVINAIVHNDYTREIPPKFEIFPDRLEITSYGGLFEGMTRKDLFSGLSLPKNKELMRIYRDLDMVEQLGSGIPRILRFYNKNCFIVSDNYIRIVFPVNKKLGEKLGERLTKNQILIIDNIKANPTITITELNKIIGISTTAIENNIKKLKNKGLIKRIGSDKAGYWKITGND